MRYKPGKLRRLTCYALLEPGQVSSSFRSFTVDFHTTIKLVSNSSFKLAVKWELHFLDTKTRRTWDLWVVEA